MKVSRLRAIHPKTLLALLLWVAAAGCASLKPQPPELSIDSVRLLELGFSEQKFGLMLRIRNPNDREFVLNRVDYALSLAGAPFASGSMEGPVTLRSLGETVTEVPFNVRLRDFLRSPAGKLVAGIGPAGHGQIDYRLTGSARIDEAWTIPFDRSGQIDIIKAVERARKKKN